MFPLGSCYTQRNPTIAAQNIELSTETPLLNAFLFSFFFFSFYCKLYVSTREPVKKKNLGLPNCVLFSSNERLEAFMRAITNNETL